MKETGILLIGILLFVGGGFWLWKCIAKKHKCTVETEAAITGVKRHKGTGKKRDVDYSPLVKYTADGNEYEGEADISSVLPSKFKEGETLTIKYNPNNPAEFCVKGRLGNIKWGIGLVLIGALMIVVYFI